MFGLGSQELLVILVIVPGSVRREPTPATRSLAGVESQGVHERHRRGPGEGGQRQPARC